MGDWKNLTVGGPKSGWPSFCPTCGKREDVCDRRVDDGGYVCEGAVRRSMELAPKPRPV